MVNIPILNPKTSGSSSNTDSSQLTSKGETSVGEPQDEEVRNFIEELLKNAAKEPSSKEEKETGVAEKTLPVGEAEVAKENPPVGGITKKVEQPATTEVQTEEEDDIIAELTAAAEAARESVEKEREELKEETKSITPQEPAREPEPVLVQQPVGEVEVAKKENLTRPLELPPEPIKVESAREEGGVEVELPDKEETALNWVKVTAQLERLYPEYKRLEYRLRHPRQNRKGEYIDLTKKNIDRFDELSKTIGKLWKRRRSLEKIFGDGKEAVTEFLEKNHWIIAEAGACKVELIKSKEGSSLIKIVKVFGNLPTKEGNTYVADRGNGLSTIPGFLRPGVARAFIWHGNEPVGFYADEPETSENLGELPEVKAGGEN